MLMAVEQVTLVHRTGTASGDSYTVTAASASWRRQEKAALTTAGLQTARLVRCRVPTDGASADLLAALAALVPGDKMVLGEAECPDGTAFAALGRQYGAATLLAIHDNTRGVCPHYYLEGVS